MTRRRKAVLSLVFGVAAIVAATVAVRKNPGDARALAIRAAQSVGAEGAEDLLRYSSWCRDYGDYWILSTRGADALWENHHDREGHYRLWFRATERAKGFRVLRQLTYGPAPNDNEFRWLIEKFRDFPPAKNKDFDYGFWGRLFRATPDQKEWAERTLSSLAASPNSKDRIIYAARAGWSFSPTAREALVKLLDDPNSDVVAEAIKALAFRNPTQLEPRMQKYLDSKIPAVRRAAWNSAMWYGENRQIQNRVRQGLWSADAFERQRAISSWNNNEAKPLAVLKRIRDFLHDADPTVRGIAAWTLARCGDRVSFPEIEKLIADRESLVRCIALRGLARNKVKRILPTARLWLRSPRDEERESGLYAIMLLDDRAALPEVERLKNDPKVGYLALEIMEKWKPKNKTVDLLQKTFQLPFGQ